MTLRYTHLSSDHKQRAVSALEQFGKKVPAIFTTARASDAPVVPQVLDFSMMGR